MPILDGAGNLVGIADLRRELGLSQSEMSDLLGVSARAVQSWEQGWRKPSPAMVRALLLLLFASRLGERFGTLLCWDIAQCSESSRQRCLAHKSGQGHLCWFLTGNLCRGQRLKPWSRKMEACWDCVVFRRFRSEAGLPVQASVGQSGEISTG